MQRVLIAVRDQGLLSLEIQTLCDMAIIAVGNYGGGQHFLSSFLPLGNSLFLLGVAVATVTERGGVGDIKKERGLRRGPRSSLGSLVNRLELGLPRLGRVSGTSPFVLWISPPLINKKGPTGC